MGRHSNPQPGRKRPLATLVARALSKFESGPSRGEVPAVGALFGDPTLVLFGGRS